jgi:predicted DNA-binding protein (UPF0251 family)
VPRPRGCRIAHVNPQATYFKPRGISQRTLEVVALTLEELEAVRLKNLVGLDQDECARQMGTSQSTLQRILRTAYAKIADALVHGKAIEINNGQPMPLRTSAPPGALGQKDRED